MSLRENGSEGPDRAESRRELLRSGARAAVAAAIAGLALALGMRRPPERGGYCDRAGRCAGCSVTEDCDVYLAMNGKDRR